MTTVAVTPGRRPAGSLAGLRRVAVLGLRLDRVRVPAWVLGIAAMIVLSGWSVSSVYDSPAAIRSYVAVSDGNPALVMFAGPGHGFDDPNIGVVLVNETLLMGAVATALMSIFAVVRHSRAEEEVERTDLLRSTVIGRHAPLLAAVSVAVVMNLAVSVLAAVGLVALGYGTTGSVALAIGVGSCGIAFAGVAAVTAQLVESARGASGWAAAVLGFGFAVRAIGDIAENWLSMGSPLGWAMGVRPFAAERWWAPALAVGSAIALVALGMALSTRRDLGSGILRPRGGHDHGGRLLTSPLGVAFRLQRVAIVCWLVGLAVSGIVFGTVANDVEKLFQDSPELAIYLAQFGGISITDAYFATSLQMMALLTSGFAISSVLRARTEETAGRVDPLIATGVTRWRWWSAQLAVTLGGSVLLTAIGGAGAGTAYAVVSGEPNQVLRLTGSALVTLPAVLVLLGVAVAIFGLVPRWSLLAWAWFAAVIIVVVLAETLRLPQWVRDLSPIQHLPPVPATGAQLVPMGALVSVGVALLAVGLVGFIRRDLSRT